MTTSDDARSAAQYTMRRKSIDEHVLDVQGVVVLAPAARRRSLSVARTSGAVVAVAGAGAGLLGLLTTITYLVMGDLPHAADGSVDAGRIGLDLAQTIALVVLLGGMAAFLLGCGIIGAARRREVECGALTTAELAAAPKTLAGPFRRAAAAADTIRASAAYREHWLAEVDLDAAVWDLARHLQSGTRLHDELKTAPAGPEYREQVEQARAALGACVMHVRDGADRLAGLAYRVELFDRKLGEPARRAELEKVRQLRAQSEAEQAGRLAAAAAEVAAIAPALDGVADQVLSVLDAYDELPKIPSDLHG